MKIYTLTLSPAYDIHVYSGGFSCGRENRGRITSYEAGGKGLNISRALLANGMESTPVILLGKENDGIYREALRKMNCHCEVMPADGRIRENITVHDENGRETRLCFDAPPANGEILKELEKHITADGETIVTFTGRMPVGIRKEEIKKFIKGLKEKNAKIVIDSQSFYFGDLGELRPWLIKPNQEEISEVLGCNIQSPEDVLRHREKLRALGIENVLVSLGSAGAVLICGDSVYTAVPEPVAMVSTIGAGDSMIAGFIAGEAEGQSAEEKLRTAVAFGTAACMTEGTSPPRREDISRVRQQCITTSLFDENSKQATSLFAE